MQNDDNYDMSVADSQYDEIGKEVEFGVHAVDYTVSPIKRDYIKWIILEKEGDDVLLVSKDVLFIEPYNATIEEVSWEDSSLNQFLQTLYLSKNEYKKLINPNEETDNDENRVFILDKEQIEKYLSSDIIIANAPDYILNSDDDYTEMTCAYWVRDDKSSGFAKPIITADGELIDGNVIDVTCEDIGVRPAIYLKEEFVEELLQSEYYW